jgi:hypothetical protein
LSEGHQDQNSAYQRKDNITPTASGDGQGESGFVFEDHPDKFFSVKEAERMQVKEPKLFEQFRPAVKHRDGRIELVKNFSPKNRYVEINVTDLSNKTKTERKPSESRDCNRTGARGAENTTTLPQDHPRIHELWI